MSEARIKMQDDEGNWEFPNEILLHILLFVSDRENISLTSKKLYELTCIVERNNRPLRLDTSLVRFCLI